MPGPDDNLTVPEAMALLKITSRTTLYNMIRRGELDTALVAGHRLITRASVEAHLPHTPPVEHLHPDNPGEIHDEEGMT